MGTFAALIFPTTLSIISNTFPERRERAAALGVWGAVVGIGVAAGPVVGGLLLEHFAWGSVFWALVPVALRHRGRRLRPGAGVARPRRARRSTCPGSCISVVMLGTLTWTIIEAPEHGWTSARHAHRVRGEPCWPWSPSWSASGVRRTRCSTSPCSATARFSAASGAVTITFFALFGFIFLITQYFQFVRGYGTLSTGARILPVALSIAVASVAGAMLAPRIGTKVVVTTGLVLFGTAFLVDLDGRRRRVVRHRDRAADGADGPRHGPDLDAGHRVDPARAAAGSGRGRLGGQRRDP